MTSFHRAAVAGYRLELQGKSSANPAPPQGLSEVRPPMKTSPVSRATLLALALFVAIRSTATAELPLVSNVELQPLAAQITRLQDALEHLGAPLSAAEKQELVR